MTGNAVVTIDQNAAEIIESVMIKGDLGKLSPEERSQYYMAVCRSVGLNPMTRPFDYITLDGKLTLYARKDCAEQLRKINGVSVEIVSRELADDLYCVHVRATDRTGRTDEDVGALLMVHPDRYKTREGWADHPKAGKPLKGVDRANAIMKCITKAKRRVTLSISGLGLPDETEIDDIPQDTNGQQKPMAVTPPELGEKKALPPVIGAKQEPIQAKEPIIEVDAIEPSKVLSDYEAALTTTYTQDGWKHVNGQHKAAIAGLDEDSKELARTMSRKALDRIKASAPAAAAE